MNGCSTAMIKELRCEYMKDPVGIDILRPRFSWQIGSEKRGMCQTAYRVLVAEDPVKLEAGEGIWDSGKVVSDDSTCCEYGGPALRSRARYYWNVSVWDENGDRTAFSETAFFEMGLLQEEDWTATWIEPTREEVTAEKTELDSTNLQAVSKDNTPAEKRLKPCRYVRRKFSVSPKVKRARVYITAHGVYSLELNGKRVGCQELAPGMSSYHQYLLYQTYDVTDMLQTGANAIGAVVADGWYAGRIGFSGDSCQYGNKLALLMQLEIEYGDGTRWTLNSDDSFLCADGPYVYSDLFIGEKYDARLEKTGWSMPDFDDDGWKPAVKADYGYGNLAAQYGEPVQVVEEIAPRRILKTSKGETVLDLGQNIAGRLRMKVSGPEGTVIRLEHTEVLDKEGNFINNILGRNKDQTDVYILSGRGTEIYEPRFTFHGFRYVRITGYPGKVTPENFRGVVISSNMRRTGSFTCSDQRFNRLVQNIFWSQRANMISIPTDCPQRERAGWTGDIEVFSPTACYNMDVHTFLTRWLHNVWYDQLPDGEVPMVVPYYNAYRSIAKLVGSETSAGWGDACVIVPWALYQSYGDRRILKQSYNSMKRWVAYIKKTAETEIPDDLKGEMTPQRRERQKYLWNTGFHYGDWLIPSLCMCDDGKDVDMFRSAYATKALVPSCFYAYDTELMAKISTVLGKTDEAGRYTELNRKIRRAFAEEYLRDDGTFPADFQGIYVLALQMRMVPDDMRGKVFAHLLKLIKQNDGKLDVGFLSVPFLLDVLCKNGKPDVARKLIYGEECPSWLYEVKQGATTMWEAWQAILPDGTATSVSYNHYAFGCVGDWIYRTFGGIDKDAPGYKHIVVKPEPDARMTSAAAEYDSINGKIQSAWKVLAGRFHLKVSIPANTSAVVFLPGRGKESVVEYAGTPQKLSDCPEASEIREQDGKVIFELKSGNYSFVSEL